MLTHSRRRYGFKRIRLHRTAYHSSTTDNWRGKGDEIKGEIITNRQKRCRLNSDHLPVVISLAKLVNRGVMKIEVTPSLHAWPTCQLDFIHFSCFIYTHFSLLLYLNFFTQRYVLISLCRFFQRLSPLPWLYLSFAPSRLCCILICFILNPICSIWSALNYDT